MVRNNDVHKLLVTKDSQMVLPKDKKITELKPGQIGFFNAATNLSFDETMADSVKDYFIAVGLGKTGATVASDVAKSSGNVIQSNNLVHYTFRPHTPARPMKVKLKKYTAYCEFEVGVKLELRNQRIYNTQGFVQFSKTYVAKMPNCKRCGDRCQEVDSNLITKQLYINIMNDPSKLVKAKIFERGTTNELTLAQLEANITFNITAPAANRKYSDIEIETIPENVNDFTSVSLDYVYPRQTLALLSISDGSDFNGEIEVTQTPVFEEGAGIDLKQLEYFTKGWTESPYRTSAIWNVADNKVYNTDASKNYDQFVISYDETSEGGWAKYDMAQSTIIAVPADEQTTSQGIVKILDAIAKRVSNNFAELDPAVQAAVSNATTVERTTDKPAGKTGLSE